MMAVHEQRATQKKNNKNKNKQKTPKPFPLGFNLVKVQDYHIVKGFSSFYFRFILFVFVFKQVF